MSTCRNRRVPPWIIVPVGSDQVSVNPFPPSRPLGPEEACVRLAVAVSSSAIARVAAASCRIYSATCVTPASHGSLNKGTNKGTGYLIPFTCWFWAALERTQEAAQQAFQTINEGPVAAPPACARIPPDFGHLLVAQALRQPSRPVAHTLGRGKWPPGAQQTVRLAPRVRRRARPAGPQGNGQFSARAHNPARTGFNSTYLTARYKCASSKAVEKNRFAHKCPDQPCSRLTRRA